MVFRPWGNANFILSRYTSLEWKFIGCLSTEKRSTAGITELLESVNISTATFIEVIDPIISPVHQELIQTNLNILKAINIQSQHVKLILFEPLNNLINVIESIVANPDSNINILFDISCFPKRFFFPILKFLIKRYRNLINNLIVLYTSPLGYSETDLSTDPNPWAPIPTFEFEDADHEAEVAIVSLGFMPFNLPDLLKDEFTNADRRFLFPFPPGPPFYQRTWAFLENINFAREVRNQDIRYIDPANVSDIFEMIFSMCNNGRRRVLLAPYGPKTMSLAMCLYACFYPSTVIYTQPKYYNPNYSSGIKDITAYSIIINGQNIYC